MGMAGVFWCCTHMNRAMGKTKNEIPICIIQSIDVTCWFDKTGFLLCSGFLCTFFSFNFKHLGRHFLRAMMTDAVGDKKNWGEVSRWRAMADRGDRTMGERLNRTNERACRARVSLPSKFPVMTFSSSTPERFTMVDRRDRAKNLGTEARLITGKLAGDKKGRQSIVLT